jgi:HK97 family phage portal protein
MAKTKNTRLMFLDGQKAVDLWGDDPTGWTILSGEDAPIEAEYYKLIPTLYRAIQLRAQAVASMPFEVRKGKTVYDSSSDWQNKVGFMPNPTTLLQLIESALVMNGSAYLFKDKSVAGVKMLRYHLPQSIKPIIDPVRGLEGFERPVNNVPTRFRVDDYVYFWLPDPLVEIGPAKHYPLAAASNACAVLMNMDVFADNFFSRGAIKAMLLTVQGGMLDSERDRLKEWWQRVVAGVKNAFGAQLVNAEKITPVVVGEGMKELENVTIGQEKREDICIAVGIPMSILFANAANYATSQQDELNFLTKTTIPECEFIASVLNEQLFKPLGLHWYFMPETLDAMQEDENKRADALNALINSGMPLLIALDILGFELTDEQRLELEQAEKEKKARAEELASRLANAARNYEESDNAPQNAPGSQQEAPGAPQNQKMLSDMDKWRRKALNALRKGDPVDVPFESEYIPPGVIALVQDKLAAAKTADEVKAAFVQEEELPVPVPIDWDLLREAVKILERESE